MSIGSNKAIELEDSILYNDLLSNGAHFTINVNNMAESLDQEIFDDAGSDDDDGDELDENMECKISPWKKEFKELKLFMIEVPNTFGNVYKRIICDGVDEIMGSRNCRFQWTFNMFLEKDDKAFDSQFKPVTLEKSDLSLIGLRLAVESMRVKEEAQFLIDYKLMYGELGCPPRIKPKADILMVVKLIKFEDIGDENACDNLSNEERKKFHILNEKIIEMKKKVADHFKNKRYRYAISVGQSAINHLEKCHLANETEQEEQQQMLMELYILLTDSYREVEEWKKVCLMINELRSRWRKKIIRNVNLLLQEAIALSNIEDDFKRSINLLRKAQQIEPNNEMVNLTLSDLLRKEEKYKKDRQEMWQKALNVTKNC